MIISIDKEPYHLDVAKIASHIKNKYNDNRGGNMLPLPGGKKLDIGRKSILRLAAKSTLVPIVLPLLKALSDKYGYQLSEHVKHEDLIDYIVNNALELVVTLESGVHIYVSTQISDIGVKGIKSFSTYEQEQIDTAGEETSEPDTTDIEDTRRGNDLLCRENGNGENEMYQGNYT